MCIELWMKWESESVVVVLSITWAVGEDETCSNISLAS